MAVVRQFLEGSQTVRRHATEVDCYYQTVGDGPIRVHLSTFGSDDRQSEPKSSQSIQLDEARAAELIKILRDAFPGLSA
jgi:5-methylcytosine-specific restriction protein B